MPEPSLGLASHVNLDRLVGGLIQRCERGGVLPVVMADSGNPAVVGLEQGRHPQRLLDKRRVGTGELEDAEALAGVQILQHVQEELVEQSVFLGGDEEGLGLVILGLDAVCRVVPLEVEQAACTKGIMTMELE